jgi:phosphatidylinositol alpha-mannosyltransferase
VLDDGRAGRLFPVSDPGALAAAASELLGDPAQRVALAEAGAAAARRYDWQTVAQQVLAVYETVILPGIPVGVDPRAQAFGLFSTRLKDTNG